jgi:uncharacterized protein (TIGR02099 family)
MPVSNRISSRARRPRPKPAPAPLWKWTLRVTAGLLLLALTLMLLSWGVLQWGILPRVNQWRPQIEARVSGALGVEVHIAGIDVGSGYWRRTLTLRQVVLKDARGEEALRLQRVEVVLSPASLLPRSLTSWTPRFHLVLVDQPQLEARRAADGRIFVAGLPVSGGAGSSPGDTRVADWLFSQGRFAIRGGALSWADELRQSPVLDLTAVDIEVRNTLNHHEIKIDATPPARWGNRFSLNGDFKAPLVAGGALARAGDWQHWRGSLDAQLPYADLRELQRHVKLPFDLQEGRGALRVKAGVDSARIDNLSADLALQDLQVKFPDHTDPLHLRQLAVQLEARRSASADAAADAPPGAAGAAGDRIELNAHALTFTTGDGVEWPASTLFLALQRDAGGDIVGGEAQAQRLDLAVLAQLAGRLPLAASVQRWLEDSKPQGLVQPLRLAWTGPFDAPQRYSASGQATGLSLLGKPAVAAASAPAQAASLPAGRPPVGRPGLRNGAVEFSATEVGGQARVSIDKGALELPGVLEEPQVPLDKLEAQLHWRIAPRLPGSTAPPGVEVQVREARFANADLQGQLQGGWRTGKGQGSGRGGYLPGDLELDVQVARVPAVRVARYLPLGLPESTRRYVAGAVRGGQVRELTARVRGDLWDFPYAGRNDGEFRVRALLEDGLFAYAPGTAQEPSAWPAFSHVRGELVFERQGMEIRNAQARLAGMGSGQFLLSGVSGGIKDFGLDPVLTLQGQGRGPLGDALQYVQASPLGGWIGHALDKTGAQGDATLQLALRLPLHDLSATTVRGQVDLAGNQLRITPATPLLSNVRARIEFTERGFALRGAKARALGGEAGFDGGTQDDGSIRFTGEGTASAEALRSATELGLVTHFAGNTSGSTAYKMNLAFVHGQPELLVTSNLVGMGSTLPVPFAKAADQALPLRVELRPLTAGGRESASAREAAREPAGPREAARAAAARDQIRVELGSLLQAQVQRDLSGPEARVLRGGIGVGEPAPAPDSGMEMAVNLPSASLDAWRTWAEKSARSAGEADHDGGPGRISLRVRELQAFGRKLTGVTAVATRAARERDGATPWRVQVEADQVSGRIEYREVQAAGAAAPEGRVYARLSRLSLPQSDASAVESLLDQTTTVPALDVLVEDFELRGKKLGRLEIEAVNRGEGTAPREWQLSKFNLTTPEAQLSATGNWTAVNVIADPATRISARRRTAMSFQLSLADSGATLNRLGLGGTLRGGRGKLSGDIAWFGSPLSPDVPSLSGTLKIGLDAGQFLKAEPGAARLLGVLSLQALPRRLLLDFRDVFQEGFSFDNLSGDVTIAQGAASTRNLRIRGVQALVLMEGSANIARETQDLRVWVVPEINAGTASLAYAIINPAIGLGTFIGQMFLRKPLIEANTREFRITGPWADPKVDRVERQAGAPVPPASAGEPATQ